MATTYYAVGDRSLVVVTFKLGMSGEILDIVLHDLSAKIPVGKDGSQWAVAAGRCILRPRDEPERAAVSRNGTRGSRAR
jgi:hypothetical protein